MRSPKPRKPNLIVGFGRRADRPDSGRRVKFPWPVSAGKNLCFWAWAIEDADPAKIPKAIRNWRGLAPEERWWLFTMTNAATGHAVTGRNRGWRKAVRYALTENPVSSSDVESRKEMDFGLFRQAT
jgi:hypothetical protein